MASDLPPFRTVTLEELRTFWIKHPSPDVRRLILEVERYRRALEEIDRLYEAIDQSWRREVGGELVGLYMLRRIVLDERMRGVQASRSPVHTPRS